MLLRALSRLPAVVLAALALALAAACGGDPPAGPEDSGALAGAVPVREPSASPAGGDGEAASPETAPAREIPERLTSCFGCHHREVRAYLGHGMAASLGRVGPDAGLPEPGVVTNPLNGNRYEISVGDGEAWLTATGPAGGLRRQRLVGRVGAGVYDTSWVGEEVDTFTGEPTGRLFFAPVETITGRGLELSPFELHEGAAGVDFGLTQDCFTCHTTVRSTELPGAQTAANRRSVFPLNALGGDAFETLAPIGCDGCHGDTSRHQATATGQAAPREGEGLGLARMRELTPGQRRDVCARCHLQGEARLELVAGAPDRDRPLAGQIPVLVPAAPVDGFRFVGQVEQLALSPCFQASPEMTCTTCHEPHTAVAAQGTASFDAACASCHDHCSRDPSLTVEEVTGRRPRSEAGCVDCHLRRDQPSDLPHLVTTDHDIRRRPPPPLGERPHQQFLSSGGEVVLYDDGRLAAALATPEGRRWRDGVTALGLMSMGRIQEAAGLLDAFAAPGTPEARRPSAPPPLEPLETAPAFHHIRALVLQVSGRFAEALAAYGDALALDPGNAASRMGRARLWLDTGNPAGALTDTETVIAAHPRAEPPWLLRADLAMRARRPDMAVRAFESATTRWPSNPFVWHRLAMLRQGLGDARGAEQALARARALKPDLPDLPGPAVR